MHPYQPFDAEALLFLAEYEAWHVIGFCALLVPAVCWFIGRWERPQ